MIYFPYRICTNELQTLIVSKVLTLLLQTKELKEVVGKINIEIKLSLDLKSMKLSRRSSLLFGATSTSPLLIWTGKLLRGRAR